MVKIVPEVSIIASAVRVELYEDFYSHLASVVQIPFEVILAGDMSPDISMPPNFRYIETPVKPAQCIEVAARSAKGKYLLYMEDDMRFFSEAPVETLIELYEQSGFPHTVISCSWREGDIGDVLSRFYYDDEDTGANVPWGLFMSREDWYELGGLDSRFIGRRAEHDICLRAQEAGSMYILAPVVLAEIPYTDSYTRLSRRVWDCSDVIEYREDVPFLYDVKLTHFDHCNRPAPGDIDPSNLWIGTYDRSLLEQLWTKDGVFVGKRQEDLVPFKSTMLRKKSQPPAGLW